MHKISINKQNLSFLLIGILVIFAAIHGLFAYNIDSELWSISSAKHFFSPEQHIDSLYSKPLFYFLLHLLYYLPLSDLGHTYTAKMLFVLNFVLLNYLIYKVIKKLCKDQLVASLMLLLLLANPVWIAEAFRVRADFLAFSFSLAATYLLLQKGQLTKAAGFFSLILLSLLCTPKSLLWNLSLILWYFIETWPGKSISQKRQTGLFGVLALFTGVLAYEFILPLRLGFGAAWVYFVETVSLKHFSKLSYLLESLIPLNYILASRVMWIILGMLLLFSLLKYFLKKKSLTKLLLFLLPLILFALFNPKTAFLFSVITAHLYIGAAWGLNFLISGKYIPRTYLALLVCGISSVFSVYYLNRLFKEQNDQNQIQFAQELIQALAGTNLKIFDSMGLLPRHNNSGFYVGSEDRLGNEFALESLKKEPPDLIIITDKVKSFLPEIESEILPEFYEQISLGVYLKKDLSKETGYERWAVLHQDPTSLYNQHLLWPGH